MSLTEGGISSKGLVIWSSTIARPTTGSSSKIYYNVDTKLLSVWSNGEYVDLFTSSDFNILSNLDPLVYADGQKPKKPTDNGTGWRYSKEQAIATDKINWYFYGQSTTRTETLSELRGLYARIKFDAVGELPFFNVYTRPTGTGDASSWYHSKVTYALHADTPNIGEEVVLYVGSKPKVSGNLRFIELKKSTGASIGDQLGTEELLTIAFSTNSAALVGSIDFTLRDLGYTGATSTQFLLPFKDAPIETENIDNVSLLLNTNMYTNGGAKAAEVDPGGQAGWYYKKDALDVAPMDKVNWYFYQPSTNITETLGDLRSTWAQIDIKSLVEQPHIAIYTQMQNDGNDAGTWYRSRLVYTYTGPTTTGLHLFHTGTAPKYFEGLKRIPLTLDAGTTVGPQDPSEELLTISLQSNSATGPGDTEFTAKSLGYLTKTEHEFLLHAIQSKSDLTFLNGLTKTGDDVKLGGELTDPRTSLLLKGTGFSLNSEEGTEAFYGFEIEESNRYDESFSIDAGQGSYRSMSPYSVETGYRQNSPSAIFQGIGFSRFGTNWDYSNYSSDLLLNGTKKISLFNNSTSSWNPAHKGIQVTDTIDNKGLTGQSDFSPNNEDLDYVQKIYVDKFDRKIEHYATVSPLGNDATGQIDVLGRPFKTIRAAKARAVQYNLTTAPNVRVLIYVSKGDYPNEYDLAFNGDYFFEPGANVKGRATSEAGGRSLFNVGNMSWNASEATTGVELNVLGYGNFEQPSSTQATLSGLAPPIFGMSDITSTFYVECEKLKIGHGAAVGIYQGNANIKCKSIDMNYSLGGNANNHRAVWVYAGEVHLNIDTLKIDHSGNRISAFTIGQGAAGVELDLVINVGSINHKVTPWSADSGTFLIKDRDGAASLNMRLNIEVDKLISSVQGFAGYGLNTGNIVYTCKYSETDREAVDIIATAGNGFNFESNGTFYTTTGNAINVSSSNSDSKIYLNGHYISKSGISGSVNVTNAGTQLVLNGTFHANGLTNSNFILAPTNLPDTVFVENATMINTDTTVRNIVSTVATTLGVRNSLFVSNAIDDLITWTGLLNANGSVLIPVENGVTTSRPTSMLFIGRPYFDTDLGYTVKWNGTDWVNATGTVE